MPLSASSLDRLLASFALLARNPSAAKDSHGNVSCLGEFPNNRGSCLWIKPSGFAFRDIGYEDVVGIDLVDDKVAWNSNRKPSVDLKHHLSIYRRHDWVRAICHLHSPYAVAHAVACVDVLCATTEQADYFGGPIRVLPYRDLDVWGEEVRLERGENAVLLGKHGSLTFADDPVRAVELALALEDVCYKNLLAQALYGQPNIPVLRDLEAKKWYARYSEKYGQR